MVTSRGGIDNTVEKRRTAAALTLRGQEQMGSHTKVKETVGLCQGKQTEFILSNRREGVNT